MRNEIDEMIAHKTRRGQRLAAVIWGVLLLFCMSVAYFFPGLFTSILPIPQEDPFAQNAEREKKHVERERRRLPEDVERKLAEHRKQRAKKDAVDRIVKMQERLAELEKIEELRMQQLVENRDIQQDHLENLERLSELLNRSAEDHRQELQTPSSEELKKRVSEATEKIHELSDDISKGPPQDNSPQTPEAAPEMSPEQVAAAKEIAEEIRKIAESYDSEAGDPAEVTPEKPDAKLASQASREIAKTLDQLAPDRSKEALAGLARQEENPLSSKSREALSKLPLEKLHELSQDAAEYASDLYADTRAAERSVRDDISFDEALATGKMSRYQGQALGKPSGEPGSAQQPGQQAQAGIIQALRSIERFARNADPSARSTQLSQMLAAASSAGRGKGLGSGVGRGSGDGPVGPASDSVNDPRRMEALGPLHQWLNSERIRLTSEFFLPNSRLREILPARRFSSTSDRTGWFYLDTWYVIGPWPAPWIGNRPDYQTRFPPEYEINLEANYGPGIQNRPLEWRFRQFDSVLMSPELQVRSSVYYFHTELYFEEDQELVLSVASDDAAKIWINGIAVLEEVQPSDWKLNENFTPVHFQQGFNTVLVRLQNGPNEADLSVILCDPAVLERKHP